MRPLHPYILTFANFDFSMLVGGEGTEIIYLIYIIYIIFYMYYNIYKIRNTIIAAFDFTKCKDVRV